MTCRRNCRNTGRKVSRTWETIRVPGNRDPEAASHKVLLSVAAVRQDQEVPVCLGNQSGGDQDGRADSTEWRPQMPVSKELCFRRGYAGLPRYLAMSVALGVLASLSSCTGRAEPKPHSAELLGHPEEQRAFAKTFDELTLRFSQMKPWTLKGFQGALATEGFQPGAMGAWDREDPTGKTEVLVLGADSSSVRLDFAPQESQEVAASMIAALTAGADRVVSDLDAGAVRFVMRPVEMSHEDDGRVRTYVDRIYVQLVGSRWVRTSRIISLTAPKP